LISKDFSRKSIAVALNELFIFQGIL